jgi:GNAT superfamily N-acetyltransferase
MVEEISFRLAQSQDLPSISELASKAWWTHYPAIISSEQIALMLEQMYRLEALNQQVKDGHLFIMAENHRDLLGFASIGVHSVSKKVWKLHKLYLDPDYKGYGLGRKLLSTAEDWCRQRQGKELILNVNRKNPAFGFYLQMEYQVLEEVDIPYYQFVLNDYVMGKSLN